MSDNYLRFHFGSYFRDGFNAEQRLLLSERNRIWNLLAKASNEHTEMLEKKLILSSPALASVQSGLKINPSRQNKIAWRSVVNSLRPEINEADPQLNKIISSIVTGSRIWWQNRDNLYASFVRALRTNKNYLNPIRFRSQHQNMCGSFNFRFQKPVSMDAIENGTLPVQIIRSGKHAVLRMPIHAEGFGKYRYGEWPFTWHRDLPNACVIRGITVLGQLSGAEWRLSVSILLAEKIIAPRFDRDICCGVDVGWRLGPYGLRVATAVIDGHFEDLSLPADWIKGMDYVQEIDSKLNKSCELIWKILGYSTAAPGWMAVEKMLNDSSPGYGTDWLKATCNIRRERKNKIARLERERLNIYRNFASHLVKSCSRIHIEKLDLRRLLAHDSKQGPPQKRQQRFAAISILHQCIEHASKRAGIVFQRVEAYQTTTKHIACGFINKPSEDQMIACKSCGAIYDQDANAALNIAAATK